MCSRWEEELVLKREESRRIPEAFRSERAKWLLLREQVHGQEIPGDARRGYQAFANRQAAMFGQMAESADEEYGQVQTAPASTFVA